MTDILEWKLLPKRRKLKKHTLHREPVSHHPLQVGGVVNLNLLSGSTGKLNWRNKGVFSDSLCSVLDGGDPLQELKIGSDPLSSADTPKNVLDVHSVIEDQSTIPEIFLTWEQHRASILKKFVTQNQLTYLSSYLQTSEAGVVKVQSNVLDKNRRTGQTGGDRVRARLEELDTLDDSCAARGSANDLKGVKGLTQEQFTQHLNGLKAEMVEAWETEQRVKALKIAIQCAKTLALSSPELFYPCKFMLVTDILEELGSLIRGRISSFANADNSLANSDVEETARNWFYKISAIRELLPRIYLEAALMPCYFFTKIDNEGNSAERLVQMTRGVGDPLVGAYARMYVARMGVRCGVSRATFVQKAIEDLIISLRWGWGGNGVRDLEATKEEEKKFLCERVFSPPFLWLLQCLLTLASSFDTLTLMLKLSETMEGVPQYVMLLSILKTFPVAFLSPYSSPLLQLIAKCYSLGQNPCVLLVELASVVSSMAPPLPDEKKAALLTDAWKLVVKFKNLEDYLTVATPWLRFTTSNFSSYEVENVLNDVLNRLSLSSSSSASSYCSYGSLLKLIHSAVAYSSNADLLYTMGSFQGLLSAFQRESIGGSVGRSVAFGDMKTLLESVLLKHSPDLSDPAVIQLLLSLFSSLHDGINALTTQDEKRQISSLICGFVHRTHFGGDFELQLQFYVDARAAFSSLDGVLEALIQQVCRLQVVTPLRVAAKGNRFGKMAAFERVCSAFCFITIPSLASPIARLKLYLLCGSVAMVNNCMGQGDACIKSAIKEVLEVFPDGAAPLLQRSKAPSPNDAHAAGGEDAASSVISYVCSYLVALPDPPEAPRPFYLFRGLGKALKSTGSDPPLERCLSVATLRGISICGQHDLPYYFQGVDGMDSLFGGDEVTEEASKLSSEVLVDVLNYLKTSTEGSTAVAIGVDLLDALLTFCDLGDRKMDDLALYLLRFINSKHHPNVKLKAALAERYEALKRGRNCSNS